MREVVSARPARDFTSETLVPLFQNYPPLARSQKSRRNIEQVGENYLKVASTSLEKEAVPLLRRESIPPLDHTDSAGTGPD
jgi:hypothetical protein